MPTLREIQRAMHRSLLHQDNGAALDHIVGDSLTVNERLDIHRNTHVGNLVSVLSQAFPAVRKIVGDDFFEAAAETFIRDHQPVCAYLHTYGAEFPAFLGSFEAAGALRYLRDVADLELAVHQAIHAPDTPALDQMRIAAIAPEDQGRIAFVRHPSVSLLQPTYPARDILQAVLDSNESAMAAIDLRRDPNWLLIERYDGEVRILPLTGAAACFAADIFAGRSLQLSLESGGSESPTYLADHLAYGRLIGLHLLDPEAVP